MGVTLYKAGDIHTVHGVRCELCTFDENSFDQHLGMGWFFTPEECYAEKKETEEDSTQEEVEEETETDGLLNISEMSDDEVRLIAKEKNINHWHNKNIDRLRKEVDIWQPET